MTSFNDITGDKIQSKISDSYRDNFDSIFRKPIKNSKYSVLIDFIVDAPTEQDAEKQVGDLAKFMYQFYTLSYGVSDYNLLDVTKVDIPGQL